MSLENVDVNLVRGLILILLIIAFSGIWVWAWGKKRIASFRAISMLPLEEDDGHVPQHESKNDSKTQEKTGRTEE